MNKPYATALRSALTAVLIGGAAVQAHAITIITTYSQYEPGGVRYGFTVSDWESGVAGQRSPCQSDDPRLNTCNVYLSVFNPPQIYSSVATYRKWEVPVRPGSSSMSDLLRDLTQQGFRIPITGSILVPTRDANNKLCISFNAAKTGPNLGGALNMFGPCTRVIAPALMCEIAGDSTINHKNLPDNALDGATASTQLSVTCRGPASVTVSASRTDSYGVRLRDDSSLYSKITVNGKDATGGINVAVTNGLASPLNIESTLVTRGTVTPGAFSGSTVVTISPP